MKYQKYDNKLTCTKTYNNNYKLANKNATNKPNKTHTYLGTCWKCNEFSHVAKDCKNNPSDTKLTNDLTQGQMMINTYKNTNSTSPVSPIKIPTTISPKKQPILTQ